MINKKCIVIASTLKPVDDIRSYRKIGVSLGKTNYYDVKIIGSGTKNKSDYTSVEFLSMGNFNRLSIKRLFNPLLILKKIISINPDLVILSSHELLLPGLFLHWIKPKTKLVYDIRENYYANLSSQDVFPKHIRSFLGNWVRIKEKISRGFIDLYLLAEEGYERELPFIKGKNFKIIQNKSIHQFSKYNATKKSSKAIFTGNLSVNSGVLTAITLFEKISKSDATIQLTIIGHCPSDSFRNLLKDRISGHPNIKLISSKTPVSHEAIISEINKASFGFVTYQVNASNRNCIPTKVFEYLSLNLPFISEDHTEWTKYADNTGIVFSSDFKEFNAEKFLNWLNSLRPFYDSKLFMWQSIEPILLKSINKQLL